MLEMNRDPNQIAIKIVYFLLLIYIIGLVQLFARNITSLSQLQRMPYKDRIDFLDKQYYRNTYYKDYLWLNELLPANYSFSIFYTEKNVNEYFGHVYRFNYYFCPRYIIFPGIEADIARTRSLEPFIKKMEYPEIVLLLHYKDIEFSHRNKIKFATISKKYYYPVAQKGDKYLLLERNFIKNIVLKNRNKWQRIAAAFEELYKIRIDKGNF
jgi:hypothetical protein